MRRLKDNEEHFGNMVREAELGRGHFLEIELGRDGAKIQFVDWYAPMCKMKNVREQ